MNLDSEQTRRTTAGGVLPDFEIRKLVEAGIVRGVDLDQVQPSSIDLTLSGVAYQVKASFLPNGRSVMDCLGEQGAQRLPRGDDFVLAPDTVYLFKLNESLSLPENIHAIANAKSSTGRLDIFARVIHDGGRRFDRTDPGASGDLWIELVSRSFPVCVREGSRLAQMRFVKDDQPGSGRLDDARICELLGIPRARAADGVMCHVDLTPSAAGDPIGWVAHQAYFEDASVRFGAIDVDRVGVLDPEEYFEPIFQGDRPLILYPGRFYIFRTLENVSVPAAMAAEMTALDPSAGEFRAHYAGFFDPGFGIADGEGSKGVMEVRVMDVPFVLEHGQAIAKLVYFPMTGRPEKLYGADMGSNYQGQSLRLSKHFKPPVGR